MDIKQNVTARKEKQAVNYSLWHFFFCVSGVEGVRLAKVFETMASIK